MKSPFFRVLAAVVLAMPSAASAAVDPPAPPAAQPAFPTTIRELKDWIKGFGSKDEAFVLKAMKDRKIKRSKWKFQERDELLLEVTDGDAKISFYFHQGHVAHAQLLISSE